MLTQIVDNKGENGDRQLLWQRSNNVVSSWLKCNLVSLLSVILRMCRGRGQCEHWPGRAVAPGPPMVSSPGPAWLSHGDGSHPLPLINRAHVNTGHQLQDVSTTSQPLNTSPMYIHPKNVDFIKRKLLLDLTSDLAFRGRVNSIDTRRYVIIAPMWTLKTFTMHLLQIDIHSY